MEFAMDADRESRIRERAHRMWEEEGRPDGKDREHWDRATLEIDEEKVPAKGASRSPSKVADQTAGLP
jgi:hypothetical protein